MTTTMDNIGQLWRNEFLRDLQQQRDLCAKSVASLKTNGGYRAAHERMLGLSSIHVCGCGSTEIIAVAPDANGRPAFTRYIIEEAK